MTSAFLLAFCGLTSGLWVGNQILGLGLLETFFCILASVVAATVSLISTLQMAEVAWFRNLPLKGFIKSWSFLLVSYFGIVLFFCPVLRDARTLLYMLVPMTLVTGFSIILFGPIQDQIVRKRQKGETILIRRRNRSTN